MHNPAPLTVPFVISSARGKSCAKPTDRIGIYKIVIEIMYA